MGKWVSVASSKQFEIVLLADWQFEEARFHQNLAHKRHITTQNALNASKLTFDANLVGNGTQLFLAVFRTVLSHFQGLSARQIQS